MTIKSILESYREKFLWTVYPTENSAPGARTTIYWNKQISPEESISFLREQIKLLVGYLKIPAKKVVDIGTEGEQTQKRKKLQFKIK